MDNLFNKLSKNKFGAIGVIGDSILDEYIYGDLRQRDTLIYSLKNRNFYLGGAANVALSTYRLSCDTYYFSVISESYKSNILNKLLYEKGICTTNIIKDKSRDICHKVRLVLNNKVIFRIDDDYDTCIRENIANQLYEQLRLNIKKIKTLILSDYNKGCITQKLFIKIKKLCKEYNIKLLVDCNRMHDFSDIYLLKLNKKELKKLTNQKFKYIDDITEIGSDFKRINKIHNLIITMDKDGLIFFDEDNNCQLIQSFSQNIIDTCGAGDAMIAAIAACSVSDVELKSSIIFSNYASAVCCRNMGTYAVSLEEIELYWRNFNR